MRIQDHPVASQLPHETDIPSVQPVIDDFRSFAARSDFPATVDELIRRELPQLSLHITSFEDATLVALTWPHTLMDALGGQALLVGWSLVLAGRDDEVPPVIGARNDIPSAIAEDVRIQEEFELEHKRLKGAGLFLFNLRYLWDSFRDPPRERRIIFLPKGAVTRLQERARRDVAESMPDIKAFPFVSEADILAAWLVRAVALSEPRSRPVTALGLLNARFRLLPLTKPSGVFIQNIFLATLTFLPAQLASEPVGAIALHYRQSSSRQSTEGQAVGFLRSLLRDIRAGRNPRLFFGEPNAVPIIFNNLVKIELMKAVNFGPAVQRQGEAPQTRRNPLGMMVAYHNESLDGSCKDINMLGMLGKDQSENYWLMGTLLPRAWARIEEEIRNI